MEIDPKVNDEPSTAMRSFTTKSSPGVSRLNPRDALNPQERILFLATAALTWQQNANLLSKHKYDIILGSMGWSAAQSTTPLTILCLCAALSLCGLWFFRAMPALLASLGFATTFVVVLPTLSVDASTQGGLENVYLGLCVGVLLGALHVFFLRWEEAESSLLVAIYGGVLGFVVASKLFLWLGFHPYFMALILCGAAFAYIATALYNTLPFPYTDRIARLLLSGVATGLLLRIAH